MHQCWNAVEFFPPNQVNPDCVPTSMKLVVMKEDLK